MPLSNDIYVGSTAKVHRDYTMINRHAKQRRTPAFTALLVILALMTTTPATGWDYYGNTEGGTNFSALDQITPANVQTLERAWEFRTGLANLGRSPTFQATPVFWNGNLYFNSAYGQAHAVDAVAEGAAPPHRACIVDAT